MDDELQQLEAELKRLRPVAPSRELWQRIGQELTPPAQARQGGVGAWVWLTALPVAAALIVFLALTTRRSAPTSTESPAAGVSPALLKPVAAQNLLYAARDEGLVVLDDGTTARRERLNYVDTITWKNSRTHASLTWSVPREEVRVVPVSFQ